MSKQELQAIVDHLNSPEVQAATKPWNEHVTIACNPHPHEGPHLLRCECGQIILKHKFTGAIIIFGKYVSTKECLEKNSHSQKGGLR